MQGMARAILTGGLVAGTIDIGAASLIFRTSPFAILQNIAGGLIGRMAANSGGVGTAFLGLTLQWTMSLLISAIYCLAASYFTWLLRRPFFGGLTYGVIVFFVMNYVVVPLSAIARAPHFPPMLFALNVAAMLLFGLIISFSAEGAIGLSRGERSEGSKRR